MTRSLQYCIAKVFFFVPMFCGGEFRCIFLVPATRPQLSFQVQNQVKQRMTTISTTSTTAITNALILNNEGVALLCDGKPHEAIVKIERSLRLLDHVLRSSHSSAEPTPLSSYQQLNDFCLLSCVPFLANSCGRGPEFQLFDGAMALTAAKPVPLPDELSLYTAVAMLNFAVSFHQMGKLAEHSAFKQDKVRAVGMIRKADRLYQAVQQVLEATLVEQHQQHDARHLFRFLFVAAQNNRLGIALEIGACPDSTMQLKLAMDAMLSIMYKEHGCVSPHQHSDQENSYLSEFLLNSTLLDMTSMMTTSPAPCA
jgi:hypothetical protein